MKEQFQINSKYRGIPA